LPFLVNSVPCFYIYCDRDRFCVVCSVKLIYYSFFFTPQRGSYLLVCWARNPEKTKSGRCSVNTDK
jgi:hypothetical protein